MRKFMVPVAVVAALALMASSPDAARAQTYVGNPNLDPQSRALNQAYGYSYPNGYGYTPYNIDQRMYLGNPVLAPRVNNYYQGGWGRGYQGGGWGRGNGWNQGYMGNGYNASGWGWGY